MNILYTTPFYISYTKTLTLYLERNLNMYRRCISHSVDKKRYQRVTMRMWLFDSPNFGRKEKCRNVIMSKSNKVENKNGTNVEMLDAYKCQHMIVRNFNALTLTRTFSPSLLFLFSTFSFFGIFMFRHFYFRPKLGLPIVWLKMVWIIGNIIWIF